MSENSIITKTYPVGGIPGEKDAEIILQQLRSIEGVQGVKYNPEDRLVELRYSPTLQTERAIDTALDHLGNTLFNPNEPLKLDED